MRFGGLFSKLDRVPGSAGCRGRIPNPTILVQIWRLATCASGSAVYSFERCMPSAAICITFHRHSCPFCSSPRGRTVYAALLSTFFAALSFPLAPRQSFPSWLKAARPIPSGAGSRNVQGGRVSRAIAQMCSGCPVQLIGHCSDIASTAAGCCAQLPRIQLRVLGTVPSRSLHKKHPWATLRAGIA